MPTRQEQITLIKWGIYIFAFYFIVIYITQCNQTTETDEDKRNRAIQVYVNQHKDLAIAEMKQWGIPASITLAQGILESRWGTSELATRANNHFGIKVGGKEWTGGKYCKYSNEWNAKKNKMELHLSCFRCYESVEEGYRGHSEFLAKRPRYAPLFRLAPNDYVNWSKELQACGYATDPKYPEKLISLIERFKLYEHDGHRSIQVLDQFWNGQNVKLPR